MNIIKEFTHYPGVKENALDTVKFLIAFCKPVKRYFMYIGWVYRAWYRLETFSKRNTHEFFHFDK